MKIEKFEDIIAWQKAQKMTNEIYRVMKECQDYEYRNQITRATVSVMNNIAERFERQTNKEFIQFLFIAKESCSEVRSMLYIGLEQGYIIHEQFTSIYNDSVETSKILSGFITSLKK